MHRSIKTYLIGIFIALSLASHAQAEQEAYVVMKEKSSIKCSVKYTLIGKYVATFREYEGKILFDKNRIEDSQISLRLKTDSVSSKYPKLDRIVRSSRLLDAQQFPYMSFQSTKIEKKEGKFYITGQFDMHGVKKELTLPFKFSGPLPDGKKPYVIGEGIWKLNRKEFGVIWDKHLDKGGIVVADHVVINFRVVAEKI